MPTLDSWQAQEILEAAQHVLITQEQIFEIYLKLPLKSSSTPELTPFELQASLLERLSVRNETTVEDLEKRLLPICRYECLLEALRYWGKTRGVAMGIQIKSLQNLLGSQLDLAPSFAFLKGMVCALDQQLDHDQVAEAPENVEPFLLTHALLDLAYLALWEAFKASGLPQRVMPVILERLTKVFQVLALAHEIPASAEQTLYHKSAGDCLIDILLAEFLRPEAAHQALREAGLKTGLALQLLDDAYDLEEDLVNDQGRFNYLVKATVTREEALERSQHLLWESHHLTQRHFGRTPFAIYSFLPLLPSLPNAWHQSSSLESLMIQRFPAEALAQLITLFGDHHIEFVKFLALI